MSGADVINISPDRLLWRAAGNGSQLIRGGDLARRQGEEEAGEAMLNPRLIGGLDFDESHMRELGLQTSRLQKSSGSGVATASKLDGLIEIPVWASVVSRDRSAGLFGRLIQCSIDSRAARSRPHRPRWPDGPGGRAWRR